MNHTDTLTRVKYFLILFLILAYSCITAQQSKEGVSHPAWSYNKSIYEVNVRQFSPEGTFKAVEQQLPRLRKMGVGILWLMPIHPIGIKNRKGTLGSYYSVRDYYAIDLSYGTMQDLKSLVNRTHKMGMNIIIDWVANHTAWDNVLVKQHPEFYTRDSLNNFVTPEADWTDVIDLNYNNKDLWNYMTDALKYWVKEANIDGYRCDVADKVPIEFWNHVRQELQKIKPVFMLAEWESPKAHEQAFDMTYSWDLYHLFNDVAKGTKTVSDIGDYFIKEKQNYPPDAFRMNFISNHDENSWNGTEFERLRDGVKPFFVLAATVPGMPLVYNGQEAPLKKRLSFFEKDPINWDSYSMEDFYTRLLKLKEKNHALYNGHEGGEMFPVNSNNKNVYAFIRQKENAKIVIVVNLSKESQSVELTANNMKGTYRELFSKKKVPLNSKENMQLAPWDYRVYVR